jgi:lambda family phage portal protein
MLNFLIKSFANVKAQGLKIVNRSFDGSSLSKRTRSLNVTRKGPNSSVTPEHSTLRDRTLAAHRNIPMIYSGIEKNVINEVGSGVTIKSKSSNDKFNKLADKGWRDFIQTTDTEGVINWQGQLVQAVRARRTQGEVFIRLRHRPMSWGLSVPIQFQFLESCFCPIELKRDLKNGNRIREGIELDRRGRRVAYYFYSEHPHEGETRINLFDHVRVKAKDVIHHFLPTRPGQRRGTPDGVQALIKAITFNSYDDAELVRKEQRAPYTGFMQRAVDYSQYQGDESWSYDPITGEEMHPDTSELPNVTISPGTMLQGYPGDKMTLFDGDDTGQGYADYMKWQSIQMALAFSQPYELFTGDWSNVNDRLVRVIMQQFYRQIEQAQDHLLIFQICRRCRHWYIDKAVLVGTLPAPGYASNRDDYLEADYKPQGWDYIHPEQDINAKIKAAKHDLTSVDDEVSRQGRDADEIETKNLYKIKRKSKKAEDMGIDDSMIERLSKINKLQSNELDMTPAKKDKK